MYLKIIWEQDTTSYCDKCDVVTPKHVTVEELYNGDRVTYIECQVCRDVVERYHGKGQL